MLESKTKKYIIIAVIIAAVMAIIALLVWKEQKSSPISNFNTLGDPIIGMATAPVKIIEYSDFQCPACKSSSSVVESLIEEFAGQVQLVYNDFPLRQHAFADEAASGAQCAYAQGKFKAYHDLLFKNQTTWAAAGSEQKATETFSGYAQEVGLDMTAFQACVESPEPAKSIDEDKREAYKLNVNATPTFFVNDQKVSGASGLRAAISQALGK